MNSNEGRVGATVVGIVVLVVVFLVFLRPNSTKPASSPAPATSRPVKGELRFSGEDDRTLDVITVKVTSEAQFSCPMCEASGFSITSDNPANPENGLNTADPSSAQAQFEVAAGRYSHVRVDTRGYGWTLTITPDSRN